MNRLNYIELVKAALVLAKGAARVAQIEKDATLTHDQQKAAVVAEVAADLPIILPAFGIPAVAAEAVSDVGLLGLLYDGVEAVVEIATPHAPAPAETPAA